MSVLEENELTFQRERFTQEFEVESFPLGEMHHEEIGGAIKDVKIRVPREMYENLDENDSLRIYTLRKNGVLMGYNIFVVIMHPEYSRLTAQHDVMFLHPDVRIGFNALKFLKWCDNQLKNENVLYVTQHVTVSKDYSPILKRIGYEISETIYLKRLN
jgi:hypothetical protein